jgi:hypothetical protein
MGLYSDDVPIPIPADAIVISEELYRSLAGQPIQVDGSGIPSPAPPPSADDIAAAQAQANAQAQLNQLATQALPIILQYILGDEAAQATAKAALQPLSDQAAAHVATIAGAAATLGAAQASRPAGT